MVTSETKRREKPSQSISPPFCEGEDWVQVFASLHIFSVLVKAANEKAATSINNKVKASNILFVDGAFLMALVCW
jgi:hypothetical protein